MSVSVEVPVDFAMQMERAVQLFCSSVKDAIYLNETHAAAALHTVGLKAEDDDFPCALVCAIVVLSAIPENMSAQGWVMDLRATQLEMAYSFYKLSSREAH